MDETKPPIIGDPPPIPANSPPPLPPLASALSARSWTLRRLISLFLSLGLGLFLADAIISLMDASLVLFLGRHALTAISFLAGLLSVLIAMVIYALMALTPLIPKRWFLPITLFNPVGVLVMVPFLVYFHDRPDRLERIAWAASWSQVLLGLSILYWIQRGFRPRWPLVSESQLGERRFAWTNLVGFLLVNVFVVAPVVIAYLYFWSAQAVDRVSEGFLALRPGGLVVQVRNYVRDDGKTIQLVPMSHIGEPAFYRELTRSFPTNALILMEGVTDEHNLLTNKISYQRMAKSLGLSEQQREFRPSPDQVVRADVDVEQFSTNTIDLLNLAMLFHAKGVTVASLMPLLDYSPPPDFQAQLFGDLIQKRNRRLLAEVHTRLSETDHLIVPWGAGHMPGIARGVQAAGFRLAETREYQAIQFWSGGKTVKSGGGETGAGQAN